MQTTTPLRLHLDHHWISPYSFSTWVALTEKGVPFETRDLNLARRETEEPVYRKSSITGLIPALEHGDFWLTESSAIHEYLEEVFAPPKFPALLPRDVKARARARMVMAWLRSSRDYMPLITERSTETMFYERARTPLTLEGEESAAKLIEVAESLIPATGENLFGEWSIADSDLAFALHRMILNELAVPARIAKYATTQWQRPSVRAFIKHARPAYEMY